MNIRTNALFGALVSFAAFIPASYAGVLDGKTFSGQMTLWLGELEVEGIPLATHPLIVQALVKGDLDTASNLLSLEGANINALRPGTASYFSSN